MNKKVYIVILNYNGWIDTIECLESVLKSDYENYQIIVVDNDSPNNSIEHIKEWAEGKQEIIYKDDSKLKYLSQPFEQKPLEYVFYTKDEALQGGKIKIESKFENPIILIQSGKNVGFAAGNNIGIKYAITKNDFESVWLLNNDTVIEKNTLSLLLDYQIKNDIGICGSTLMYYYNPEQLQAYGGRINKFFGTGSYIYDKDSVKNKLDYVVGASFLINRKVINTIGLLPEEYFLYYEETDYCLNAKKNFFTLGIAILSIVFHKEGSSTGADNNPKIRSEFSDILILKNRIKFHQKYLGGGMGLWIGILIAFLNRIQRGQFNRIIKVLKK